MKVLKYAMENGVITPEIVNCKQEQLEMVTEGSYELLLVPIVVEGKFYDLYVNKEGKNNSNLEVSMGIISAGCLVESIVGNFFFASNKNNKMSSLTLEEINSIQKYVEENSLATIIKGESKVIFAVSY